MEFEGQKLKFGKTLAVKEGVICDVYEFENDDTRDIGIVKVSKGSKTPLQKVLSGDRTIERFESGTGILTIVDTNAAVHKYTFPSDKKEVVVNIGETMQWEATDDLTFIEICYPPYKDGRYENTD